MRTVRAVLRPSMDTDSLWRKLHPPQERGPLERDEETEVCVVGAGIAGLATARTLVRVGCSPEIIERLSAKALDWQKELPPGPIEPVAGKNDYRWPQEKPAELIVRVKFEDRLRDISRTLNTAATSRPTTRPITTIPARAED